MKTTIIGGLLAAAITALAPGAAMAANVSDKAFVREMVPHHKMAVDGDTTDQMLRDLETLGVSMDDSGMMMNMDALHAAKPFDRKVIDMMIPHHQGAIRMARAELAKGTDTSLRKLARGIVADQAAEIRQMNAWRKAGTASPHPRAACPRPSTGSSGSGRASPGACPTRASAPSTRWRFARRLDHALPGSRRSRGRVDWSTAATQVRSAP